ncbi:MAG: nucleotidyltransferase, partial [Oscillospiraceae bacterium]|nr:nucleotidyltransferase [Oscillospiraceae bacterium]
YALPSAFDELIRNGDISVKVLPTKDKWYGMTYMDDLPKVRAAFAEMVSAGKYPADLFEDQAFSQF